MESEGEPEEGQPEDTIIDIRFMVNAALEGQPVGLLDDMRKVEGFLEAATTLLPAEDVTTQKIVRLAANLHRIVVMLCRGLQK